MPALTQRRHRQTRADIADAAISLFTAHGYDDVTMDQVAVAAGVSRRTAYRHFPNKYDLVFDHPQRWLEHFEEIIESRGPDESTRDLCRRGIVSVAELIQRTASDVLEAWTVFVSHDSLRGRNAKAQEHWLMAYVVLLAPDLGERPGADLEVMTVAGSLVAMTNALCFVWAKDQPEADMVTLTEEALDILDPLWPAESR